MNQEVWEIIQKFCYPGSTPDNYNYELTKINSGWISPEGVLYPCDLWQHGTLIEALTSSYVGQAKENGWYHLYNVNPKTWPVQINQKIWPVQINQKIFDQLVELALAHGYEKEVADFVYLKDKFGGVL